jgi:3-keto-disaccharide hydrolase
MRMELRLLPLLALAACGPSAGTPPSPDTGMASQTAAPNTLSPAEQQAGWRLLFDGKTTNGWRGYRSTVMPAGWRAVDGALTRVEQASDIVTEEQFGNFDLLLEWKLTTPGGNSGIFYRATEALDQIYFSGPEMQVLDDDVAPDGKSQLTSAGAAYGLYPAPRGAVRPLGQWNTARILVDGTHVVHWLNGVKMADYVLGSADWLARVNQSKFSKWSEYGRATQGYIGLQEHGTPVAFRNIRIKVLP